MALSHSRSALAVARNVAAELHRPVYVSPTVDRRRYAIAFQPPAERCTYWVAHPDGTLTRIDPDQEHAR